jgi:hypothetical protein
MAKKQQNYRSLLDFAKHHEVCLPKPHDWRLTKEPVTGEIQGISGIRGFAVATNGILVALENDRGDLAFGHLDWFVPDAETTQSEPQTPKTPKARKMKAVLAEYD